MLRWFLLTSFIGFTCCSPEEKTVGTSSQVLYHYQVLTASPASTNWTGLVRAITPSSQTQSPSFTVKGLKVAMTARTNPNTSDFPVTVWEGLVPIGQSYKLEGKTYSAVKSSPQDITVLGDTGCYLHQARKKNAWPFGAIVTSITQTTMPELVIHVGDYNYRGTPSSIPSSADKNSTPVYDACGSTFTHQKPRGQWGDNWHTWETDFFAPAKSLLEGAPWVMARGNHELCSRAGTGWFYLLDPGSSLVDPNYTENPCQTNQTFISPPYALPFQNIQMVMIDSANMCDYHEESSQVSAFLPVFQKALGLAKQTDSWLITHRPLYSYDAIKTQQKPGTPTKVSSYVSATMNAILGHRSTKTWYSDFSMYLAGHVHDFQFVKPPSTSGFPPLFVVGNSGIELNKRKLNGPVQAHFYLKSGQFTSSGSGYVRFGYLSLSKTSGTWQATLFDPQGNTIDQFTP